jgi:glycosyltransferase involved in cell wall biosynthesis
VSDEELLELFERACCTIVPSLREGYGIVVGESVSAGTPVVVANNPENLATNLVEQGVNGFVVDPSTRGMSEGILETIAAGESLRRSTAAWSIEFSPERNINRSTDQMAQRLSQFGRQRSR